MRADRNSVTSHCSRLRTPEPTVNLETGPTLYPNQVSQEGTPRSKFTSYPFGF